MIPNDGCESFEVIRHPHCDEEEIFEVLHLRLKEADQIMPHGWIFLTPLVTILSPTKSAPFLSQCLKEERRWIRHAQKVFGRYAVRSPQNWVSHIPDDSSNTKTKRNNYLHWTFHCRGNLFSPNSDMPDEKWRTNRVSC